MRRLVSRSYPKSLFNSPVKRQGVDSLNAIQGSVREIVCSELVDFLPWLQLFSAALTNRIKCMTPILPNLRPEEVDLLGFGFQLFPTVYSFSLISRCVVHFSLLPCSTSPVQTPVLATSLTPSKNTRVYMWIYESRIPEMKDYALMQSIKMSSTLRVSLNREKPSPRIVFRHGKQDEEIRNFMRNRRLIKHIMKEVTKLRRFKIKH